jgi:EAL domain-containing protein (putative c-di-GMP-specific phosphodiesterase class I)
VNSLPDLLPVHRPLPASASAGATVSYLKQAGPDQNARGKAAPGVSLSIPTDDDSDTDAMLREHLLDILGRRLLSALFQPIVHMQSGEIVAYEGLIRGPSDSPLHAPMNLFKVARANGLTVEVEHLCRRVVLERFAELQLPGKIFLNVSPECLLQRDARHGETLEYIHQIGIQPERVIIELTENQPTYDYDLMREAVLHYRTMGFQIAIDDLGEGFSSLRLWSELRPEYVKIDMHFIQGINTDPVKLQFVRSIQEIADKSNTMVIAEGIETQAELLVLRDVGVALGQGYHLGRPTMQPARTAPAEVVKTLARNGVAVYPQRSGEKHAATIFKLLHRVAAVPSSMSNNEVYEIFLKEAIHGRQTADRRQGHQPARPELSHGAGRRPPSDQRLHHYRRWTLPGHGHGPRPDARNHAIADHGGPLRQSADPVAGQCADQRAYRPPAGKRHPVLGLLLRP